MSESPYRGSAPPRLHHIALGARDVARVAAFYRDTFGLPERARHHYAIGERFAGTLRAIWLGLGGESVLMIEHSEAPLRRVEGVGAGPFLLALHVDEDEREDLEARLEDAGAPIEARTTFSSYARDPEGNRVAISHYPLAPTADKRT